MSEGSTFIVGGHRSGLQLGRHPFFRSVNDKVSSGLFLFWVFDKEKLNFIKMEKQCECPVEDTPNAILLRVNRIASKSPV